MLFRLLWSEWRDSNSRHPGPKPGALPTGPHPDIKLKENARCGQICGQRNSTTVLPNFQRRYLRGNQVVTGEYPTFGAVEPFWCSSSQTRRPSCCGARHLPWRTAPASAADRCHSLSSLAPPPAAVASLPNWATPGNMRIHARCSTYYT